MIIIIQKLLFQMLFQIPINMQKKVLKSLSKADNSLNVLWKPLFWKKEFIIENFMEYRVYP